MNCELPDVQARFRKGRQPEIKFPTSTVSWKKQESSRKNLFLLYCLCQSLWLCGSQQTGKIFKRWKFQTTWSASWETCMQARKQQLELDMEQQTVPNRKRSTARLYTDCHPDYLTSMQSTSWEMLGWKKHKLESRLLGEISITSDMQMTPPLWQKVKRN